MNRQNDTPSQVGVNPSDLLPVANARASAPTRTDSEADKARNAGEALRDAYAKEAAQ